MVGGEEKSSPPPQFMQTCDICQTEGHYRLRYIGNSVYSCVGCLRTEPKDIGLGIKEWVKVGETWATKRQLKEMERRVILPYNKPDGGYYLGRRGENGKVQENRQPDYR